MEEQTKQPLDLGLDAVPATADRRASLSAFRFTDADSTHSTVIEEQDAGKSTFEVESRGEEGSFLVGRLWTQRQRRAGSADGVDQVTFTENDPSNPYNWSLLRKWSALILMSFSGLNTLMASTMMAPALSHIGSDLGLNDASAQLAMTIFVLGFAFGPMLLSPLTEIYGRKPIWIMCGLWFLAFNTLCGFAQDRATMIAGRFLAGMGGSGDFAIGTPVLSDIFRPEQRGQSFAILTILPLLGLAIGPLIGGFIDERVGWQWLFWTLSIYDAVVISLGFMFWREPYGPVILERKARILRNRTGDPRYHTEYGSHSQLIQTKLTLALTRPLRMLAFEPTIQIMALALAINFSILYIVLSTFATMWMTVYHESVQTSGLHYLALCIGYTIASQVGGRLTDKVWNYMKRKASGQTAPEYRVPLMVPGGLLIPIGLLWYGWSAQSHTHWIMPDIGTTIFGCGTILSTYAMQQYVLDAYKTYAASATAASQFPRFILAFAFPSFAPSLYQQLGYGWGNTVLAGMFVVVGFPMPLILWFWGKWLREKGKVVN